MKWHTDPAHGWLEVKTKQLIELDIVDDISAYSYLSPTGLSAYLEEDSDATVFINAFGRDKFNNLDVKNSYRERTPIRNYPDYQPEWVNQNRVALLAR